MILQNALIYSNPTKKEMCKLDIKHGTHSYYIGDNEEAPMAEMAYVNSSDRLIIIDHTTVGDELRGKGVGNLLLQELIRWARSEDKKIMPLCPFAKAQMEKNPEYRDMIY